MNNTISILILILVLAALFVLFRLTRNIRTINRRVKTVMNAIDRLNVALDQVGSESAAGFEAIGSALTELAEDIANIPSNENVDAAATRASGIAQQIAERTAAFAQQIRDAIPTPVVEDPEGSDTEGSGTETSGTEDSATEDSGSGVE